MNHYLIFSAINDYFKDISSLDSGRIIAAFIYMDQFIAKVIAEEVILHTIPEYYDKYRGNPDPFDLQQVLDEAAKRGYSTTQGSTIGIVVFCFCFDRSSRLVPSISAFRSPNLRFYISIRSFRPDFLSILNDRGVVPL